MQIKNGNTRRKKMTLGKRIFGGFFIVLILMVIISVISLDDFHNVVKVIEGNQLNGTLVQKEIAHLNWVNKVNALLTDEHVTSLNVETNARECAFGKWLYGEERAKAEAMIPELAPLLKQVEAPHRSLHESAIEIGAAFRQPHQGLAITMANLLKDHVTWSKRVSTALALEADKMYAYQSKMREAVKQAISTIGYYAENEDLGDTQTRQAMALEACRAMRYGPAGEDYFWINDTTPRMLMHPYTPELEGADLTEKQDPDGKKLFVEMVKISQEKGEGFLTYQWPKNGEEKPAPKISYVELYKPWGWIIGAGLYLDQSDEALLARSEDFALGKPFQLGVQTDSDKCALGKFLKADSTAELCAGFPELKEILESMREPHERLHDTAKEIERLVTDTKLEQALKVYEHDTEKALQQVAALFQEAIAKEDTLQSGFLTASRVYSEQTLPSLKSVQSIIGQIREEARKHVLTDEAMLQSARNNEGIIATISIIAIILGVGLAVLISKSIIKALTKVTSQMSDGIDQVVSASTQVASASQSLAEGASEQAASVEETSSSLEEMSSMTKQNADNANQANSHMKEADDKIAQANGAMNELTTSMGDISSASEEISKIIKTIDEIAFQTNLLALNAAVEAARAGEAGAGFAVVADEVRNLAMRAADAAKSTTGLIEGTVKKIKDGSELVTRANQTFTEVSESSSKVGELVAEISAASTEQAQGIDQVNKAVAEMDKVTQQNAAGAEESASAAEELNAQAEQMRGNVAELSALVGGNGNKSSKGRRSGSKKGQGKSPSGEVFAPHQKPARLSAPKEVKPAEAISPDDKDLMDF